MNDFLLGPQVTTGDWFDTTLLAQAKRYGEACPVVPPTEANALDSYTLLNYYDLPATEYTAHRRTNDPLLLALGDKCADAWWQHPTWIGSGTIRRWPDEASPPPRHAGVIGLLCRAESRPEMYDWINDYSSYFYQNYVGKHLTKQPNGTYTTDALYDVREGAFAMRFLTMLAKVLPDSFPLQSGGMATNGAELRAKYLAAVEIGAVEYFGKNQRVDGAYVWNDDWTDSDGGKLQGVCQPFMIGLLLRTLCDVHALTANTVVKENVKNQILKGCRHLYSDGPYIKDEIEQKSGKRIRGFHYFYHGGTTVNPTRYEQGDIKFPWIAEEAWWLPGTRQATSTILGAFGYAYSISGDSFFKDAGNEMYDAAYGGSDGVRAMMSDTSKNCNQHVWGSSSYKAWAGGVSIPTPIPTPAPSPTPPTPTPQPSPDGIKGTKIIDSEGATWTIGPQSETLRNGTQASGGSGIEYKYLSKIVYVKGDVQSPEHNWYKWLNPGWESVGLQEPGTTAPPVPPIPEPPTPPTFPAPKPCTISAPSSITIRANSTGSIPVTLNDLSGPAEVRVSGSDGQVTVTPLVWNAGPTSTVKQFGVRVKRQSRTITFSSPCGSVSVRVNVT